MPMREGFDRESQEALDVATPTRRFEQAPPPNPMPAREPMREPYQQPAPVAVRPRVPWTERLRRWVLGLALLGLVAAGLVLAPYVVSAGIAAATVVLRSLSLSASAAEQRRLARGSKWYDGVLGVFAAPWHFLVSLPGTVMLLAWTLLIVACVGLLLVVFKIDDLLTLATCGVVLGVVHWTGPGSSRLRSPVRRAGLPLARAVLPFAISTLLMLGAAAALVLLASTGGVEWAPFSGSPWGTDTWLGRNL